MTEYGNAIIGEYSNMAPYYLQKKWYEQKPFSVLKEDAAVAISFWAFIYIDRTIKADRQDIFIKEHKCYFIDMIMPPGKDFSDRIC